MAKIGMPNCSVASLLWSDSLDIAIKNRFDAFEINMFYPSVNLDCINPMEIEKARVKAEKADLEICVHSPPFEINIGAFYQGLRDESVNYVSKSIDFCSKIGGNVIIVHSGAYTYSHPEGVTRHNNGRLKTQWDNNIESLKKINGYAEQKGITVCLENMFGRSIDKSFEDLIEIRDAVGESLKYTFDIGHARLKEENGIKKGLSLLKDNIRHIHFTDNKGVNDDHLQIGDGNTDYSDIMDFIKDFPYVVTLEVIHNSSDPSKIIKSREYFNSLKDKKLTKGERQTIIVAGSANIEA
ncbi:MAG: sugar phosphate isomerase/epimerase [Desulfobacterales bacterium]|nr:sugar phosphate isomerase/epimerase [Desulfobacterales bacterium]MCP4163652.1 sugar phosphate isomerase/epimerase [Deltaproteobacteria bacterium]